MKIRSLIDILEELELKAPDTEIILYQGVDDDSMKASANLKTIVLDSKGLLMLISSEDALEAKKYLDEYMFKEGTCECDKAGKTNLD